MVECLSEDAAHELRGDEPGRVILSNWIKSKSRSFEKCLWATI